MSQDITDSEVGLLLTIAYEAQRQAYRACSNNELRERIVTTSLDSCELMEVAARSNYHGFSAQQMYEIRDSNVVQTPEFQDLLHLMRDVKPVSKIRT